MAIADDFTHFAAMKPSVYSFLSSYAPEKGADADHHSPFFAIDEDVLWEGCAVYCAFVSLMAGETGNNC